MATLTVSATKNYTRLLFPQTIDLIDFTNGFLNSVATATFSASQVDGAPINLDVVIDGNANTNNIVVNGSSIDANQWTFTNWTQTVDSVTFNGTTGADVLVGSHVRETINGRDGADVIEGRGGRDTLNGEAGNDVFVYSAASHLVSGEEINGGDGTDRIRLDGGPAYDFRQAVITGIERLEYTAMAQVLLLGTQLGAGLISLVKGHAGFDSLEITGTAIDLTGVTFNSWTNGSDSLFLRGSSIAANVITGSSRSDIIHGGILGDTLTGGIGNDSISGFGGADVLSGGAGDDTFLYWNASDAVAGESVSGGSGTDEILLQFNSGLYQFNLLSISSVETLRFGDPGNSVSILGSQLGVNRIATIVGAGNTDSLTIIGSVDLSQVTFQTWSSADLITMQGQADVDDVFIGSAFSETINGNSGNDVIRGGAGADNLIGGSGIDTLSYEGSAIGVTVNLATNQASGGDAAGDTISGFENVTGSGANDTLTGSDASNVIEGGGGNDVIAGGLGADTLKGGNGNDTFNYAASAEVVFGETIDGGGGNQDAIVLANVNSQSYDFRGIGITGVERLVLLEEGSVQFDGAAFGGGTGLINTITGSAGENVLSLSGQFVDLSGVTLVNWTAPPLLVSGGDFIAVIGGGTDDVFTGSSGTDVLYGLLGSDTLDGGAGADFIYGGVGQDFLTGGADGDLFAYMAANESAVGASRDRIMDFTQGSDLFFFENFDAIPGGNQDDFVFIGTSAFVNGEAGRLRYFQNNAGNTILEGEVTGDGVVDFQIQIMGLVNLAAADFAL